VGAIVAVNVFGDVVDPSRGQIIAGARKLRGEGFANTVEAMGSLAGRTALAFASTAIAVVATNARLSKAEANVVARAAHDGLARVVRPAHTIFDGDTVFALATGAKRANVALVGALAAEVMAEAILRGVRQAESVGGIAAARDMATAGIED